MTIPTNVMMKLATIGLSIEQAEAVADMLTAVEVATEASVSDRVGAAVEAGREKARARWHRWNEKQRSNVGKRLQTAANASQQLTGASAPVEDKTSNSEIEPPEVRKKAARGTRLTADWRLPIEWRQDALDAGLPEHLIDIQAVEMRDWSMSSTKGVKLDWRATWRGWCRRAAKDWPRAGPPRVVPMKDTPANAARRRIEAIENEQRNDSETDDHQSAAGLIPGHSIRLVG